MPSRILAAIHAQPWAIMPGYLEAIEALAIRALEHPAVLAVASDGHADRHFEALAIMGDRATGTRTATIRDGVGALPMFGPILPRAAMLSPSGAGAVALDMVAADLRALEADKAVRRILIVSDSPGGAITNVREFGQLVANCSKQVSVHITGQCCSAMYWIASQAKGGMSIDPIGLAGSIGVMMGGSVQEGTDAQGRRDIAVVSSGAPNKRPDLATDEGLASIREMLDAIEDVFIADVARGRGVTEATVRSNFGAGGTKTGKQAQDAGMVDRVEAGGLDATMRRLSRSVAPATSRRTAEAHLALAHARAANL